MEKLLNISTTLSLPSDVVTQREAILAVSGAGKSNAARAMAEEFFAHKLPFVAVDPKGDWWGLRAGRDGSPKGGLDVVIFGGAHGDVPLERNGGAFVADLITKERLSCILDLKGFESKAARKHFLFEFAQRLYQKNQDPLKLFLDEADDYLPQKPMKDELRLLSAFEDIVRRGRSLGLGVTLITQRSAVVSKNVLTQCETLYVLRTTGPQDVAAVEAWMKYHGADGKMLATLAKLEDGEAWVWSPHYLKKMERFRFRLSYTFDSGATPVNNRAGSKRRAATLSDVDVAAIAAQMSETIERVAAEDPRALRKKVAELTKALAVEASRRTVAEKAPVGAASEEEILPWRQWVGQLRAEIELEQGRTQSAFARVEDLESYLEKLSGAATSLTERMRERPRPWAPPKTTAAELNALALSKMPGESARKRIEAKDVSQEAKLRGVTVQVAPTSNGASNGVHREVVIPALARSMFPKAAAHLDRQNAEWAKGAGEEIKAGELRILGALSSRGPLSKTRLAILTGYQHTAGGFATTLASLRARGWVDSSGGGTFVLTEEGLSKAKGAPAPLSGEHLAALWGGKLSTPGRRLFEALLGPLGGSGTAHDVAVAAGYKNAAGGNVAEGLAELRRYGLVEGTSKALSLGEAREDFA